MTEDDAYLAMIAVRQAKKVKNTRSGASNLSLCMSYVVKRDTRAYSRLPLPLLLKLISSKRIEQLSSTWAHFKELCLLFKMSPIA